MYRVPDFSHKRINGARLPSETRKEGKDGQYQGNRPVKDDDEDDEEEDEEQDEEQDEEEDEEEDEEDDKWFSVSDEDDEEEDEEEDAEEDEEDANAKGSGET